MNRLQVLLLVLLIGFVALVWLGTGRVLKPTIIETVSTPVPQAVQPSPQTQPSPSVVAPPLAQPSSAPLETATPPVAIAPEAPGFVGPLNLIIPVAGVRRDQLVDTFTASRAEGRVHDAIDIIAPANTPVLATADGTIVKLWQSERGGTTIYQLSADKKLIFYYAHLARYADGLIEGKQVRQGEVVAYVGDTGNAGPGNYHLHFSIAIVSDPKRYWEGTNINPYPLLHK